MLASKYRLKRSARIEKVKRSGRIIDSEGFTIKALKREDKEPSCYAFVVSTKISKLATQRNRIKRALEHAVRYNQTYIRNGYDFVFLVKKISLKWSTQDITNDVVKVLKKSNMMVARKQ